MLVNPALDGLLALLAEATVRALESATDGSRKIIAAHGRGDRAPQRRELDDSLPQETDQPQAVP